jgi:hypothetical protein
MIFKNTNPSSAGFGGMVLTDYGYQSVAWPNFGSQWMTPNNYPIADQIGVGPDTLVNATTITAGKMYEIATVGSTSWTSLGASANTVGVRFISTSSGSGTGTAYTTPAGVEPVYLWNNVKNGGLWVRNTDSVHASAIAAYGSSFTERDLIAENRDFFAESGWDSGATGAEGCRTGTTAAMNAYTPSVVGFGWWATDQGTWNQSSGSFSGYQGKLYKWTGSVWSEYYTPYTYPHPARSGAAPSIPLRKAKRRRKIA